jgi:type VI protein secretion system component Hcp
MAESSLLFMKISGPKGPIHGDCKVRMQDKDYRQWIDVDDWRWTLKNNDKAKETREARASAGATPSQVVEPSIFSFSKLTDSATTEMLAAMQRGDRLKVTLVVEDASLELFDLSIKLEDARFTSYQVSARAGEKQMAIEEEWNLDYKWIIFEYQADKQSGMSDVRLYRRPGLSTDAPEKKESQLIELALHSGFDRKTLQEIWAKIERQYDQAKATLPEPDQ